MRNKSPVSTELKRSRFRTSAVLIRLSFGDTLALGLTGCGRLFIPPMADVREEVRQEFLQQNHEISTELNQTISVCQPMLGYYADRSLAGERTELAVSFSGMLAGVAGAALVAASPANAVWAAGFSAYAGATNAASQKLAAGGLQGEDAARHRAALATAVTKEIGLALDTSKPLKQRRAHLYSAQATCALELASSDQKFPGKLDGQITPLLNYEDFVPSQDDESE